MESDIIVEGFKNLLEKGVRILEYIGDNDASVFYNIRNKIEYGDRV